MLCLSCQRQSICLAYKLAQDNPRLETLLAQLKTCELQVPDPRPVTAYSLS